MTRDAVPSVRERLINEAITALCRGLKPCPAAKRNPYLPTYKPVTCPHGWVEKPIPNPRNQCHGHHRPNPLWDFLFAMAKGEWLVTPSTVCFERDEDAQVFTDLAWFHFRRFLVVENTSRGWSGRYAEYRIHYRGNDEDEAVWWKMLRDGRELWAQDT